MVIVIVTVNLIFNCHYYCYHYSFLLSVGIFLTMKFDTCHRVVVAWICIFCKYFCLRFPYLCLYLLRTLHTDTWTAKTGILLQVRNKGPKISWWVALEVYHKFSGKWIKNLGTEWLIFFFLFYPRPQRKDISKEVIIFTPKMDLGLLLMKKPNCWPIKLSTIDIATKSPKVWPQLICPHCFLLIIQLEGQDSLSSPYDRIIYMKENKKPLLTNVHKVQAILCLLFFRLRKYMLPKFLALKCSTLE